MVWHVHFKDGKFAIWNTFIDKYVTGWKEEAWIVKAFQERAARRAKEIAEDKIRWARENGFCSELKPFRCKPEEVESG